MGVALALVLSGTDGYFSAAQKAGFASNSFGDHSPSGFGLMSVAIIEIVVTAIFVLIVLAIGAALAGALWWVVRPIEAETAVSTA